MEGGDLKKMLYSIKIFYDTNSTLKNDISISLSVCMCVYSTIHMIPLG